MPYLIFILLVTMIGLAVAPDLALRKACVQLHVISALNWQLQGATFVRLQVENEMWSSRSSTCKKLNHSRVPLCPTLCLACPRWATTTSACDAHSPLIMATTKAQKDDANTPPEFSCPLSPPSFSLPQWRTSKT